MLELKILLVKVISRDYENLWFRQWWQSWHNDSRLSVLCFTATAWTHEGDNEHNVTNDNSVVIITGLQLLQK